MSYLKIRYLIGKKENISLKKLLIFILLKNFDLQQSYSEKMSKCHFLGNGIFFEKV